MDEIKKKYPLGGRPVKFKSPEEMMNKIYEFLSRCDSRCREVVTKSGEVVTINQPAPTTLEDFCVFAGITKTTFYAYGEKKGFGNIVKQYEAIVEAYWVRQCAEGEKGNKADFILKNMKNWKNSEWNDKNINEIDFAKDVKQALVSFVESGDDADGGCENSESV